MNEQHAMPDPQPPQRSGPEQDRAHTGPADAELDALLGAFALDALDADERDTVEDYVRGNDAARRELTRYEDVLAALASADAETAPADLWDRVQSQLRPAADVRRAPLGPWATGRGIENQDHDQRAADVNPAGSTAAGATVTAVTVTRPRRWRTAGLALAAALALLAGTVAVLGRGGGGGSDLGELAQAAERADGSRVATMNGTAGTARLIVDRRGNGYLLAEGLERLDQDQTYQLWSLDGDQPVSLAVLGPQPTVVALPAAGLRQVALSVERAGGQPAPTLPPVAVGTVGGT